MSAKFTKGPYRRDGRHIHMAQWSATVHPYCKAIDTAELEAVAALFQAAPLLYEALEDLHAVQNGPPLIRDAITWHEAMDKAEAALRVARGEE